MAERPERDQEREMRFGPSIHMAVPKPIERSNQFQSPTDDPLAILISEKTLARHTTTIPFLPFPFINFPNSSALRSIHACYSRVVWDPLESTCRHASLSIL